MRRCARFQAMNHTIAETIFQPHPAAIQSLQELPRWRAGSDHLKPLQ
jgi:hypothetical protein